MKHISSKLILMTVFLVTLMMSVTGFISLLILKAETRAYVFQNQLLQAQNISKEIEIEISKLNSVASELLRFRGNVDEVQQEVYRLNQNVSRVNVEVVAIGVQFKNEKEPNKWIESAPGIVSRVVPAGLTFSGTYVYSDPKVFSDAVVLFNVKNAMVAIRILLQPLKSRCEGSSVGVYNRTGSPIFFCDPKVVTVMSTSTEAIKQAIQSNFQSGSFEKDEKGIAGLWAYSDLSNIGKVVSFTRTADAYRPAYLMTLKIMLLVLMAIGIGVMASILVARMVVRPIHILTDATQRIEGGDFDTAIDVKTKDETSILARAIYSMAQKIKELIKSEVEKTKLEAQLELAGAVQRTLIPTNEIELGNYQISSFYKPADECGGDWWGYVQSEDKIAVFIGDVTGHGYASALLVATTKGYLSMLQADIEKNNGFLLSPGQMLQALNRVVYDMSNSGLNMTALCILIDRKTGVFKMATAGHNPVYQIAAESKVSTVEGDGARLGEQAALETLVETDGQLGPGEKLVFYTDGVQDIGPSDHPVGRKGFKKFLMQQGGNNSSALVAAVSSDLLPLHENRPLIDDITFVVVENRNA